MKLILTQSEAIERLRHFLRIGADVQVIISRPRAKTPPNPNLSSTKPKTEPTSPHRRVFEQIEALDHAGKDKVQCIRILRENFKFGLVEAKCIVEQWDSGFCKYAFCDGCNVVAVIDLNGKHQELFLVPR